MQTPDYVRMKKYLMVEYKIDINDQRPLLEIVIEKFRKNEIKKVDGVWRF